MTYPGGGQWPEQHGQYVDPMTGQPASYGPSHQQPGYQQYGSFPQGTVYGGGLYPGQEPPKKRGPVIAAVVLVVVLLAGLGAGGYFYFTADSDDGDDQAFPGGAAESSAQQTQGSQPPASTGTSTPETDTTSTSYRPDEVAVDAVTSGWQGVWSPKDGIAYDVPKKNWQVATPGTIAGYESARGDRTVARGVTTYRDDYCGAGSSGWRRGMVGTHTAGDVEPDKAARIAVILWGGVLADKPQEPEHIKSSKAKDVEIDGGKATAKVSTGEVPISYESDDPKKCRDAKTAKLIALAFKPKSGGDTRYLIIVTHAGVSDELSKSTIDKILKSVRPYEK